MKINFVGQKFYFECAMPEKLEGHEIEKINLLLDNCDYLKNQVADVWIMFCPHYIPHNILQSMKGKKVWVSTEPIDRHGVSAANHNLNSRFKFDYITHYDKTQISKMISDGIDVKEEFQLPVNLERYRFDKKQPYEYIYDLFFSGRTTLHRDQMMNHFKRDYKFLYVVHGLVEKDFVDMVRRSKICLNVHIQDFPQLQHRVQNYLACGAFVLSEKLTHNDGLKAGEHFIEFSGQTDLKNKVEYYLLHEDERNEIAESGRRYVINNFDAEKKWESLINKL